jgi:proteasome accessory factor B
MNRTERMYELAAELQAAAPNAKTARQLAERFDVSVRTIERDVAALAAAGVPIDASDGPGGGYRFAHDVAAPPIDFTATEATAIAVALSSPVATQLGAAGQSVLDKVAAAFAADVADREITIPEAHAVEDAVSEAVASRQVLEISYLDRTGERTDRVVEPHAIVRSHPHWYLVAWCRLREDGRGFRSDRIQQAVVTDEPVPNRPFTSVAAGLAASIHVPPFVE